MEKLAKEVRFLKRYSIALTLLLAIFVLMSFRGNNRTKFEEIDVERINVLEKDGTLKMVISNSARQHPGMANGKSLPQRKREAGMIFFNSAGYECGGLVYDADKSSAGMVYSVDQFRNDQIMQLQYMEDGSKNRTYGFKLWDRPDNFTMDDQLHLVDSLQALHQEAAINKAFRQMGAKGFLGRDRLFLGKTNKGEVGLFICDDQGRPRIRIYVDKNNQTQFETLDEEGNVIKRQ